MLAPMRLIMVIELNGPVAGRRAQLKLRLLSMPNPLVRAIEKQTPTCLRTLPGHP